MSSVHHESLYLLLLDQFMGVILKCSEVEPNISIFFFFFFLWREREPNRRVIFFYFRVSSVFLSLNLFLDRFELHNSLRDTESQYLK